MTPQSLQIPSPEDSFTRLRIITNSIVSVNIVFRVYIAGRRRLPVPIQSFTYLFLLHDHLLGGMKPGVKANRLSRPNLYLDLEYSRGMRGNRELKVQFECITQIVESLFLSPALAGNIKVHTLGNKPVSLAPDGSRKRSFHETILAQSEESSNCSRSSLSHPREDHLNSVSHSIRHDYLNVTQASRSS
jgi:hypothetical protein